MFWENPTNFTTSESFMDSNLIWTIIARRMDFLYKWLKIKVLVMHFNNKYKAKKYKTYKWY